MGTNFFGRKIPSKKRKEELCNLIEQSSNWKEILNEAHNIFDNFDGNETFSEGIVHLGKRSAGWKFLWNPNMYIQKRGHCVSEEIEPGHTRTKWINEPDFHYYVYPLTKEGIWNFINQPDIEIINEYDEVQEDKNEFFEGALNWTTWEDREAWDSKSYHEYQIKNGEKAYVSPSSGEYIDALRQDGFVIDFPYNDFYSDGLRFSINNWFR